MAMVVECCFMSGDATVCLRIILVLVDQQWERLPTLTPAVSFHGNTQWAD